MNIEEYKKAIIDIVKKMEEEHGCDIERVEVFTANRIREIKEKRFNVKIEII